MATVRVSFDVYDVPEGDTGVDSFSLNQLVDELSKAKTTLTWEDVSWEEYN